MTTALAPVLPSPKLQEEARQTLHRLKLRTRYALVDRATGDDIELPAEAYDLLRDILAALARGQAVSVLPSSLELTTNQAADMLNVSRGFVIKLLDNEQLQHRMVGTHRRVRLDDVLRFRDEMQHTARGGLDQIADIDLALERPVDELMK